MFKNLAITLLSFLIVSISFGQKDDPFYNSKWAKIDSLQRKGLYRMALSEVHEVFDYSTKNQHHNQVIKSVLYELKYNTYLEEDDYVLGISRLDELIKTAPSPSKEILHSLTAEVYWGYYSSNQWKFIERTHVGEVDLKDIRTWDLKRIAEKVRDHYVLSLMNAEKSKSELIKNYKEIASYTDRDEAEKMRPTLYDFLAYRALDFFRYQNFNVPGPGKSFIIDNPRYLANNSTFIALANSTLTVDSLNTKFYAVKIFGELTEFHQKKDDKNALFYAELERLKFIRTNAVFEDVDKSYYTALERLVQQYQKEDYSSEGLYEMAKYHSDKAGTYNYFGDTTYHWNYKIAMQICDKSIKLFPNAYGSEQCKALKTSITYKELNLNAEQAAPVKEASLLNISYRNVNKLYYKIVPYNYDKLNNQKVDYNKLLSDLRKTKGLFEKEITLKDPGDYQAHTTEIEVPGLDNGHYFLIVSSHPQYSEDGEAFSYCSFWSTDITYQMRNQSGERDVLVSNRKTGAPLAEAKAIVSYQKWNSLIRQYENKTLGTYTTDQNGVFSFKPKDDYYNYYIEVKHNGQVFAPNASHYAYRDYQYTQRTYTHFFTDRTIYRPGQTIYYKGIVVDQDEHDRQLKKNYKTTVYFYDVNSQEIAHQEVTTNEFGSFSGEFTAPFGVLTGQMRIQDTYGSKYFRVEEYKRPKFNVTMNPIEGEFQLNDNIEATGFAQAFAGNFIDGAEVKYRVTRTTSYYGWYSWYYWRPYEAAKEIASGNLTTDENGEFKIPFEAIPDMSANKKNLPVFTYTITVDVTDINGETHTGSSTVMVGYQSLKLNNNLRADINGEKDFMLELSTTNLNGQDVDAQGTVVIEKLKGPEHPLYSRMWQQPDLPLMSESDFKAKFSHMVYKDENNQYNWDVDKEVLKMNFDTKITDSIEIKNLKKWQPGVYKYTATAKDKNGVEVKDVAFFTLFKPSAKVSPTNDVFWLKELKSKAEPGDVVSVLLGTAEDEILVNYSIEVKNKIVSSDIVTLKKEQKKLDFKVTEEHRGNFTVHFSVVKNNRSFSRSVTVIVPHTNKELDLEFSTFRNKLLPGQDEEWTMTIKNKNGEGAMAELLATMYDASLDELYSPNAFYFNVWRTYYGSKGWQNPQGISSSYSRNYHHDWNPYYYYPSRYFPSLNYHGYSTYYYGRYYSYGWYDDFADGAVAEGDMEMEESVAMDEDITLSRKDVARNGNAKTTTGSFAAVTEVADAPMGGADKNLEQQNMQGILDNLEPDERERKEVDLSGVKVRSNFNETAFFYPQLLTDKDGNIKIKFTIPESLTKWKFIGMAHTQDLSTGMIEKEVVTQKDLMVVPNAPRFLREGDKITLSAKISNISDKDLEGAIQLDLLNPFDDKLIDDKFKHKGKQLPFKVDKGKSTSVSWTINVPYETSTVKYRFVAAAGDFSDGEESVLPILSNRMLVTESMPMPIRGKQSKTFKFDKLVNNKSKTLKHHRYTVEFTSNPAWYALQAMPYMMEYPHECAEQTFTRYYSNAIAAHVLNSNPKIREIINKWGEDSPDAFLSNLQKNQELKAVMLEETPWVLNAKSEEETKRNLAILLDMERMTKELDKALGKTIKNQAANGGWPWFPGMRESRYITQHIITGMGHLDHLGISSVKEDRRVWNMIKKGVDYLDGEIVEDYRLAKKYDPDYEKNQHIGYSQIQYLYARSYFKDISMNNNTKEAVQYYKDQAIKFWLNFNIYGEGMLALAAHRFEMKDLATDIVKSLKDRSIHHEEFGMYWKEYQIGYYWYQAPIETQALMIEMFDEVTDDQESVEDLKVWLLKQKQTTHWKTTKQTTEAVYALLLKGTDLLASDELVQVVVGDKPIEYVDKLVKDDPYKVKPEAGTGYFKTAWKGENVVPKMGDIKVTKKDDGVAWGAAYWQYFEDLDKITYAETNLKLEKDLFLINLTKEGEELVPVNENNELKVGDKMRVRIELRTDRNLEYVHMKDMRASGFEPINVLSTYKYRDGLGYYEATKDAATHFFFDYIPKGTYVFEYDLRVQHKGDMSNGIATIQCMYAPEFTSHSDGIRVHVKE
ncbi:MG2 domain-containing protein [Paracrocinitomix mangrovi]|uniref:alpha-2-macroglobulin family protein n=1 Tax=Paracrocinitomix mangrovi TaxID=2862509 RepID=UPI001C8D77E0|nr:alpha-2-macroglobulin family protein [Paracrocinitomix mangrovi]UKN00756.1 MG2 domain-containing protein [Paracrocinitomix mangrovi]